MLCHTTTNFWIVVLVGLNFFFLNLIFLFYYIVIIISLKSTKFGRILNLFSQNTPNLTNIWCFLPCAIMHCLKYFISISFIHESFWLWLNVLQFFPCPFTKHCFGFTNTESIMPKMEGGHLLLFLNLFIGCFPLFSFDFPSFLLDVVSFTLFFHTLSLLPLSSNPICSLLFRHHRQCCCWWWWFLVWRCFLRHHGYCYWIYGVFCNVTTLATVLFLMLMCVCNSLK